MYTSIRIFIIGLAVVTTTAFDVHYNLTLCPGGFLMVDLCQCKTSPSNQFDLCLPLCFNGYVRDGICRCSVGYTYQEGRCVLSIEQHPHQCPTGSKMLNGLCFTDKLVPIICPAGCQRSFMTQTCICEEFGEVTMTCDTGFELRSDRCVRRTEVKGTCSSGYVKVEKDGVCLKSVLVTPVCPDQTIKDAGGTCFRKTVNCSSSCRDEKDGCDGKKYCPPFPEVTTTTHRPNDSGSTTTNRPNDLGSTTTHRPNDSRSTTTHRPNDSRSTTTNRPNDLGSTTTHRPNDSGSTTTHRPNDSGTTTTHRPNDSGSTTTYRPNDSGSTTTHRPNDSTSQPTPPGCSTTSTGSQCSHSASSYMTYTHNNISSPTIINLKNENNLNITIIRNKATHRFTVTNGTETIYEGTDEETNTSQEVVMPNNCCDIYGPRQCAKADDGAWHCWHTRHHRCGSVCRKPKLFIRPRRVLVHKPIVIVPPYYRSYYDYREWGTHLDCSGCGHNWKLCPPKCSSYDCQSDTCGYEDQESFCETYGGDGCTEEDGCLGDYCAQS